MLPNWIKTFRRRWIGSRTTYRHEPIRLNLQPLEDRTVPTLASPPTQFLATDNTLRAIANPDLNADGKADLAALDTDGTFTVALNDGNNGWTSVTSTNLGRTDVWGMSFGLLDTDLYTDCVIQTSDGVMIGRGDGQGRLTNWRSRGLGAAGSFAGVGGARVDPAIGYLGIDLFADIVAVAPATNEFVVLRGDGTGEFGAPLRYASGGVSPVTAWVGNFVGEGTNDVAVGHRDGTLTIFDGVADGSLTRSATTVSGLGTVTGLSAADVNGDGELDLVVSGTRPGQRVVEPPRSGPGSGHPQRRLRPGFDCLDNHERNSWRRRRVCRVP